MARLNPAELADRTLDALLRRIDRSRLTPQGWASRRLDRFSDERHRRAGEDARWQQIQTRRGPGGRTLLSEDLAWSDWEEQRRIEERLTPDPWWLPTARRVASFSLVTARHNARHRRQRSRRGWSDADTWSLDHHLCRTLAGQLDHLAANGHVWPGEGGPWVDEHAWQADLRRNAALLRRYADSSTTDEALGRWHDLAVSRDADPQDVEDASQDLHDLEQRTLDGARQALHWVADNLHYLWD